MFIPMYNILFDNWKNELILCIQSLSIEFKKYIYIQSDPYKSYANTASIHDYYLLSTTKI